MLAPVIRTRGNYPIIVDVINREIFDMVLFINVKETILIIVVKVYINEAET